MKHFKYLCYVLKHKWYVFLECKRKKRLFLGVIHDWSKLRLSEWLPYVNHFYGPLAEEYKNGLADPKFDLAWLHHQKRNRHHWQYWLSIDRKKNIVVYEMPPKYLDEMICDWIGATLAKGQEGIYIKEWYNRYKDTMILALGTRMEVEKEVLRK